MTRKPAGTFDYTFTGQVETVFPTLRTPTGNTLVCVPGQKVTLTSPADHPLLVPVAPPAAD